MAWAALVNGTTGIDDDFSGALKLEFKEFYRLLVQLGGFKKFWIAGETYQYIANEISCLRIVQSPGQKKDISVSLSTSDQFASMGVMAFLKEHIEVVPPEPVKPQLWAFSKETYGFNVQSVGFAETPLVRGNYNREVVKKYDYVVKELNKELPSGRLVLLEGTPGTGKTRMVSALVTELMQNSMCIVVPPSLMDNLSGPDFTKCLINHSRGVYLTLILEDADDCLIAREQNAAAKSSLAALLNLSDGLLGAALNLRVVVTTNQTLKAIDKAVMRPGRLLSHIQVDRLEKAQAESVYQRLTGETIDFSEKCYVGDSSELYKSGQRTLAEVYEEVRVRSLIKESPLDPFSMMR